jgi:hypothetical protein
MIQGWSALVGLLVTILTFLFTQWEITGKWAPVGTAIKGVIALVVSFVLAVMEGLFTGAFDIHQVWAQMPTIVATALAFYGVIVKPIDKVVQAKRARDALTK